MNPNFPRWFEAAYANPSAEDVAAGWVRVESVLKNLTKEASVELVRASFELPSNLLETLPEETASSEGSAFERAIIAAAAVMHAFENASESADVAALACVCRYGATSKSPVIAELPRASSHYLERRGMSLRERVSVSGPRLTPKATSAKRLDTIVAALEANLLPGIKDPLVSYLEGAFQDYLALGASVSNAVAQLSQMLRAQGEESDMFWWIYSRFSRDLRQSFDDTSIDPGFRCLLAAKELADLTTIVPGPRSAAGLLDQIIGKSPSGGKSPSRRSTVPTVIKLQDAVNAAPREWRQSVVDAYGHEKYANVVPVLAAVASSLMTDDKEDWVSVHHKSATLNGDIEASSGALAMQVYQELQLVKILR